MSKFKELFGQELYSLLYEHYDEDGILIDDFDDVIYFEDYEISLERLNNLKLKLRELGDSYELPKLEVAKLLASWGDITGVEYLKYFVNQDRNYILSPHRIFGHETVVEECVDSLFNYQARMEDRSEYEGEKASKVVVSIFKNILSKSLSNEIDISSLIEYSSKRDWKELDSYISDYYKKFSKEKEKSIVQVNNLKAVEIYNSRRIIDTKRTPIPRN